jgi:hypothetical protein
MGRRPLGKKGAGGWERLTTGDEEGVHRREWSLSDLTPETVRERWGAGEYRVYWFIHDPANEEPGQRYRAAGTGPSVLFDEQPATRIAAPAAPAPAAPVSAFHEAMQFMALADERAGRQLNSILSAAGAIAGRQSGGMDPQVLTLLLDNQRQSTQLLLQQMAERHEASMTALRAELATLRGELEEDDDEPAPVAAAVRAAAPLFKKGEPITDGIKAAIANYVTEHPDELWGVIKQIPAVVTKLSEMAQQQGQHGAAPPVARPRATVHAIRAPEPEPPVHVSGLNAALAAQPPTPRQETAPAPDAAPAAQ